MRRATGIGLVLLGGGLALGLSTCDGSSAECRRARAEGRPDAEQLCARSSGSGRGSGGHSWTSGGTSTSTSTSSQHGGFGGTASHVSAGG